MTGAWCVGCGAAIRSDDAEAVLGLAGEEAGAAIAVDVDAPGIGEEIDGATQRFEVQVVAGFA